MPQPELELEKINALLATGSYPRIPVDKSPSDDPYLLYTHNLVTAYYLRYQLVINPVDKLILDVGCGTGYNTLSLAAANPGAKVIGIDGSPASIELAAQRAAYQGYTGVEFYTLEINDLAQLGLTFDYINCDRFLYLLADPAQGLKILRSHLQPQGIIRVNLHSYYHRLDFFQAQELFKLMGLQANVPEAKEVKIVRETMAALNDQVILKAQIWEPSYDEDEESVLRDFLLVGDKGFTITEMATMLEATKLELVSMVNWRQWQLLDLFQDVDTLPLYLNFALATMSAIRQLEVYELLHPIHEFLDFWCGHQGETPEITLVADWEMATWQEVTVHLHPQLLTELAREEAIAQVQASKPFQISWHLPLTGEPYFLDTKFTSCLISLWDSSQSFRSLVARWQALYPLDPLTLAPLAQDQAQEILIACLIELESLGYVLLSR